MPNFITVTDTCRGEDETVWLNTNYIRSFKELDSGATCIELRGKEHPMIVKQSPKQIAAWIRDASEWA